MKFLLYLKEFLCIYCIELEYVIFITINLETFKIAWQKILR